MNWFKALYSQKSLWMVGTVLLLTAGIAYFYLVEVKSREDVLNRRAFKSIDRFTENVEKKLDSYERSLGFISRTPDFFQHKMFQMVALDSDGRNYKQKVKHLLKTKKLTNEERASRLDKALEYLRKNVTDSDTKPLQLSEKNWETLDSLQTCVERLKQIQAQDSIENQLAKSLEVYDELLRTKINAYFKKLNKEELRTVFFKINHKEYIKRLEKELDSTHHSLGVKLFKLDIVAEKQKEKVRKVTEPVVINHKTYILVKDTMSLRKVKFQLTYAIDFKDFIDPVLYSDFLEEYLIFYDSSQTDTAYVTIYNSLKSQIAFFPELTPRLKKSASQTKHFSEMRQYQISGEKYQAYLQPIMSSSSSYLLVCGLVPYEKYNRLARHFDPNTILLLLLLIGIAGLSLPIENVFFREKSQPLAYSDYLLSLLSLLTITSLLTILLSSVMSFSVSVSQRRKEQLKNFSNQLTENFEQELEAVYYASRFYDHYEAFDEQSTINNQILNHDFCADTSRFKLFLTEDCQLPDSTREAYLKKIKQEEQNHLCFTNNILSIDENGLMNGSILRFKDAFPLLNLSHRKYFTEIQNKNYWQLSSCCKDFYLESIYSYVDGNHATLLSIPSEREEVAVLAINHQFNTLNNAYLPEGFEFAIVDESSMVLFHSDEKYILQERLLEELDDNIHFASAIRHRNEINFHDNYHDDRRMFHLEPIGHLPLFVVVYENDSYYTAILGHTLSLVGMLILCLFVFLLLIFFSFIWMAHQKEVMCPNQVLNELFLFPRGNWQGVYLKIAMIGLGFLLFLIALFFITEVRALQPPQIILLVFISLGSALFYLLYYLLTACRLVVVRLRNLFVIPLLLFGILVWIGLESGEQTRAKLLFLVLSLVVVLLPPVIQFFVKKKNFSRFESRYLKAYKLMGFQFIILLSILPTLIFFELSFRHEFQVLVKYRQFEFLRHIKSLGRDFYLQDTINVEEQDQALHLTYDSKVGQTKSQQYFYINPVIKMSRQLKDPERPQLSFYHDLLAKVRLPFNAYTKRTIQLPALKKAPWYWHTHHDTLELSYEREEGFNSVQYFLHSEAPSFKASVSELFDKEDKLALRNRITFTLMLLIAGILLYLLYVIFDHLIDIIAELDGVTMPQEHFECLNKSVLLYNLEQNQPQFVLSPPASGFEEFVIKTVGNQRNIEVLDLAHDFEQDKDSLSFLKLSKFTTDTVVLIKHFAHRRQEPHVNHFKYLLLQKLRALGLGKVIILSSVTLESFLTEDKQLNTVLKDFVRYYYPLMPQEGIKQFSATERPFLVQLTKEECCYGVRLKSFRKGLYKSLAYFPVPETVSQQLELSDKVLFECYQQARFYYRSLWDALTIEEQHLLYDLADDGLVNMRDKKTINHLLNMGYIRIEQKRLELFNKSFHTYVLNEADQESLRQFEARSEDNIWQKIKLPFMLSLTVLFFFILISQGIEIKHIIPIFTALVTAVPTLLNFSPQAASASNEMIERTLKS